MTTPIINYSATQEYTEMWQDHGSGAFDDVGFYRPVLSSGESFLGDYAQGDYDSPYMPTMIISGVTNDDPNNPALAAPSGYNFLWAYLFGWLGPNPNYYAVWSLVAPDNYFPCGAVVSSGTIDANGWDGTFPQPSVPGLVCVRFDLCKQNPGSALTWVWDDKGSGNSNDVGVWLEPSFNVMWAVPNYDTPGTYYAPGNPPPISKTQKRGDSPASPESRQKGLPSA